jgi:hypothetical protein
MLAPGWPWQLAVTGETAQSLLWLLHIPLFAYPCATLWQVQCIRQRDCSHSIYFHVLILFSLNTGPIGLIWAMIQYPKSWSAGVTFAYVSSILTSSLSCIVKIYDSKQSGAKHVQEARSSRAPSPLSCRLAPCFSRISRKIWYMFHAI